MTDIEIAECINAHTGFKIGFPYKPHPAADLFPLIEGEERTALLEDIRANGVLEPIVIMDDMVLDGRNRYLLASEALVQIPYVEYTGDDPIGFIVSRNLRRRHLNTSQRAMLAAKLARMSPGRPAETGPNEPISIDRAAGTMSVSRSSVKRAKAIEASGVPELVDAVQKGSINLSAATDIASLPEDQQKVLVAKAKELRTHKKGLSRQARVERINSIAEAGKVKTSGGIPKGFAVIYADPPWKNDVYSEDTGSEKSPPYPVMELPEIMDLCAGDNSPATDDAVLYLWTTGNRIEQALKVMTAWGFTFKSSWIWDKEVMGTGRWVRDRHELILIGTRGSIPAPAPSDVPVSVYCEKRGAHSVKPVFFADQISKMYPDLPKLELFGRASRDGWASWGFEAP